MTWSSTIVYVKDNQQDRERNYHPLQVVCLNYPLFRYHAIKSLITLVHP